MTAEEITLNLLNRLPDFYEKEIGSLNYGLMYSFAQEFEEFDNEAINLHIEVFVTTATGTRLDDLGKLFKLSRRSGETDDQFRIRIISYWPGFSGGGTLDAIKSTIGKITGIPPSSVVIIEDVPPAMKFDIEITLLTAEDLLLVDTLRDVVWHIKAAGVYPFFTWVLDGTIISDDIYISDAVGITVVTGGGYFIFEVSLLDGTDTIN